MARIVTPRRGRPAASVPAPILALRASPDACVCPRHTNGRAPGVTSCRTLIALAAALFHLVFAPSSAHAAPRTLEPYAAIHAAHATILYHPGNAELANTVAEAFEFAHAALGPELGYPKGKITIRIYDSTEEMAAGLMALLGYERPKAELIATIGISPNTRSTMHLHARTKHWGPYLWHGLTHEYAHGLVEQGYGAGVATSARWLYEGLGDYAAERALKPKLREFETAWSRSRFRLAFKALIRRDLFPLERVTTEEQWLGNIAKNRYAWDVEYAQAYAAAKYLVERYGFDGLRRVLEGIEGGLPCQAAIAKGLGISLREFDAASQAFIFRQGMAGLWMSRTAVLTLVGGSMAAAALLLLRTRRRGVKAREAVETRRARPGTRAGVRRHRAGTDGAAAREG